ncbi:MAG: hypothetical protein ACERKO_11115 [Acetanaerobacterium sp.]
MMKRKVMMLIALAIAVILVASFLAPILFAETVNRGLSLPNIMPVGMDIVIYTAAGALVLIVIVRIILGLGKKK